MHREKLAQVFLVAMSLWFYAYFNLSYLAIILGSCAVNYILSYVLEYIDTNASGKRNSVKWIGVIANLGILAYFKYYDFFVENVNSVFHVSFNLKHIILPLGISFFTFQQLSFIIDRYRGDAPHYDIVDYLTYVTFFPQLVAGPIVLHSEFMPQLKDMNRRHFDIRDFAYGVCWFIFGLAKKILLADILGKSVDFGFSTVGYLDTLGAMAVALAYTFQIYLDFSGYCDMAIGIGKMFRIELPDNFDAPYSSYSIKEFWRRWHMTLGRFFTKYVYIPLGGNRKGKTRQLINTMIVFSLSGLWHGANWTFVVWGIIHGIGASFNNVVDLGKSIVSKTITFAYVALALVIFRADNLRDAGWLFKRLFAFDNFGKIYQVANAMEIKELYPLTKIISVKMPDMMPVFNVVVFCIVMCISAYVSFGKTTRQRLTDRELTKGLEWKMAILFVWCVISFSQVSSFLYFNF